MDKSMFLASIYAKAQFSGLILYFKENAEIKRRKITKKVLKERWLNMITKSVVK